MLERVKCPHCGRMVTVKRNGTLYPHAAVAGNFERFASPPCRMSNQKPALSEDKSRPHPDDLPLTGLDCDGESFDPPPREGTGT